MGCSSCQQNNHVVTSVTQPSLTTPCECACGCSEPVCPTPQPCTEILDSKCIAYTDLPIVCGSETVVTTNASVSTALNQIVSYFCGKQGAVTTEDILCGDFTIVPVNTSIQEALVLIVQFICNIQLTPGPAGADGTNGTNGTNAFKYVHQEDSVLGGDSIIITRAALETCGVVPVACSSDTAFGEEMCDLHVNVYYNTGTGDWYKIPMFPLNGGTTEGYQLRINDSTGDIVVRFAMAAVSPAARVRIVVLA